jgi:arginine repressor
MNKRLYSLAKLLTELQAAKGLFQQSAQVYVAEKDSSSKPKGKKKKRFGHRKLERLLKQWEFEVL